MSIWRALISVAMPFLSYTGLSGTSITAARNGLFEQLRRQRSDKARPITKPQPSLQRLFTVPIQFCQTMVHFFMPVVSLEHPELGLQGIRFLSTWMSAWLLMNLESLGGNQQDPSKKFLPVFGVLMEMLGVGVVLPLWCLTNIWFSHTEWARLPAVALPAHPDDVRAMAWSLLVGAGIPTFAMYFSSSQSSNTLLSKQLWIVIRLFHPIMSHLVYHIVRGTPAPSRGPMSASEIAMSENRLRDLNGVAFWMSISIYALCAVLGILTELRRSPSQVNKRFAWLWPSQASPWKKQPPRLQSMQAGIGTFLIWDEAMTSAAIVLWALAVNRIGLAQQTQGHILYLMGKVLILAFTAGPAAAAATLVW